MSEKGTRRARILAGAAVLATLTPLTPGRADHSCDPKIVVFSHFAGAPRGVSTNGTKCVVDSSDTVDGRTIQPGATAITIRYTVAYSNIAKLDGELDGVGFSKRAFTLPKTDINTEFGPLSPLLVQTVYLSSPIAIAPTASGCLKVTIIFFKGTIYEYREENYYHTVASACT